MKGEKPKNSFSRPAIDLSTRKREWREIPLDQVQEGDTVVDVGLVADIHMEHFRTDLMQTRLRVRLINVVGDAHDFFCVGDSLKDPQGWKIPLVRAFVEV